MGLATFVKINAVNNLSDARYCAGMEVDQLGFAIEEGNENYVSPNDFKELADWVSGVEYIGEVYSNHTDLSGLKETYQLDGIQVNSFEMIAEALKTGLKVSFLTNDLALADQALTNYPDIAYVLLSQNDTAILKELDKPEKVVIDTGFDASNIRELIEAHAFKGIAMQGGQEIRPGFKDFDELADILETLDTDEYV